jgi:hypothetical protein
MRHNEHQLACCSPKTRTILQLVPLLLISLSHDIASRTLSHVGKKFSFLTQAYEWSGGNSNNARQQQRRPEVNRHAIAGIWKLTPTLPHPLKEFTVYPKQPRLVPPELLLLLKEDGSFQQCGTPKGVVGNNKLSFHDNDEDRVIGKTTATTDLNTSWKKYQQQSHAEMLKVQQQQSLFPWIAFVQKGQWDYVDGNLLLAADRSGIDSTTSTQRASTQHNTLADGKSLTSTASTAASARYDSKGNSQQQQQTVVSDQSKKDDTLLKGRLIANYQTQVDDHSALTASSSSTTTTTTSTTNTTSTLSSSHPNLEQTNTRKVHLDTQLLVPRGSINVGKFMYPKHHPSFFDQPIFQPSKVGTFTLRQVLGNVNTMTSTDPTTMSDPERKHHRSDFYNKTFLLTSHPLKTRSDDNNNSQRGEKRWSIKYNDYVYDAPSKKKAETTANPAEDQPSSAVRVLQIVFHRNNTFSTTGGLGTAAILRGKYDIVGTEQDHIWMQVIRFGFGRSVSGSVYSEGPMLSHEDIKAYWGTIRKYPKKIVPNPSIQQQLNGTRSYEHTNVTTTILDDTAVIDNGDPSSYRIEVEGSVLDGIGLEPIPVARFILREMDVIDVGSNTYGSSSSSSSSIDDEDDEEDDDDDEVNEIDRHRDSLLSMDNMVDDSHDGIDWTIHRDESFQ